MRDTQRTFGGARWGDGEAALQEGALRVTQGSAGKRNQEEMRAERLVGRNWLPCLQSDTQECHDRAAARWRSGRSRPVCGQENAHVPAQAAKPCT